MAPLLCRAGYVRLPLPGGCRLGPRPVDIHLAGLAAMGAEVELEGIAVTLRRKGPLHGVDFTLRLPSVGATMTLLMAACCAQGRTVLRGAAREPEIGDVIAFLCACGADISGYGTSILTVQGGRSLGGAVHAPLPDRIAAATYAAALAAAPLQLGVPDDGTNLSRGIKLLEAAGFIKVDPAAGYTPEIKDITDYLYNVEVTPVAANTLPSTLGDFAASTINGTYAVPYGLIPSRDALLIEKQDENGENPYVNVIVARTADKDNEVYQKVVEAYQTQLVAEFLLVNYHETFYPAFAYDADAAFSVTEENVAEISGYKSSKDGKTVVKVGVCGGVGNNEQWIATQKVLDDEGANIYIDLVEFDAYNLPNEALNSGDIDLNAFQHKAYLAKDCSANGYDLTVIGDTLIAPLCIYSEKYDSIDAIKEAAGAK